jgi:hypothetical protein
MFFSPEVVNPQDDADEHRYISALPRFLFIILDELQKGYRPTQPAKKIDMMHFALNCGPNLECRLAAMISEMNAPEENNDITFINLDRHWTRFDGDRIRRVPTIEEMVDRWERARKALPSKLHPALRSVRVSSLLNTPTTGNHVPVDN